MTCSTALRFSQKAFGEASAGYSSLRSVPDLNQKLEQIQKDIPVAYTLIRVSVYLLERGGLRVAADFSVNSMALK